MAFESPTDAQSVALTSDNGTDGATSDEANLNDDDTGTSASAEIRTGMSGYKIIQSLGFPVANLDNATLSVRCFDGVMMTAGEISIYPYNNAAGTTVDAGEEAFLTINDNGAYDTVLLPSSFVDALVDTGTDEIQIRFAPKGIRGRFNEIQIQFSEAISGPVFPYHIIKEKRRDMRAMLTL